MLRSFGRGFKMLDFEIMDKALKIDWIKRLIEHDDAAWKIIPEFAATDYGGLSFLIECQYDVKYLSYSTICHPFTTPYLSIGKNIIMNGTLGVMPNEFAKQKGL